MASDANTPWSLHQHQTPQTHKYRKGSPTWSLFLLLKLWRPARMQKVRGGGDQAMKAVRMSFSRQCEMVCRRIGDYMDGTLSLLHNDLLARILEDFIPAAADIVDCHMPWEPPTPTPPPWLTTSGEALVFESLFGLCHHFLGRRSRALCAYRLEARWEALLQWHVRAIEKAMLCNRAAKKSSVAAAGSAAGSAPASATGIGCNNKKKKRKKKKEGRSQGAAAAAASPPAEDLMRKMRSIASAVVPIVMLEWAYLHHFLEVRIVGNDFPELSGIYQDHTSAEGLHSMRSLVIVPLPSTTRGKAPTVTTLPSRAARTVDDDGKTTVAVSVTDDSPLVQDEGMPFDSYMWTMRNLRVKNARSVQLHLLHALIVERLAKGRDGKGDVASTFDAVRLSRSLSLPSSSRKPAAAAREEAEDAVASSVLEAFPTALAFVLPLAALPGCIKQRC